MSFVLFLMHIFVQNYFPKQSNSFYFSSVCSVLPIFQHWTVFCSTSSVFITCVAHFLMISALKPQFNIQFLHFIIQGNLNSSVKNYLKLKHSLRHRSVSITLWTLKQPSWVWLHFTCSTDLYSRCVGMMSVWTAALLSGLNMCSHSVIIHALWSVP